MYLLNEETTITWELLATATPPVLADLDLVIIDPNFNQTYLDSPIQIADYTPPTELVSGTVVYKITPNLEGFWRIRLVTGVSGNYNILSKVEMQVFDSVTTTSPFSSQIGEAVPYDINFYLQGFVVPGEIYGGFVSSRTVSIDANNPDHVALAEESPEFFETSFLIMHNGLQVGTIVFPIASLTGNVTIGSILVNKGDKLQIKVDAGVADARIRDIAINLAGCATVIPCTIF